MADPDTRPTDNLGFAIVTDSAACIPKELQERYDITVVPLAFLADGRAYRDGESLSNEEFYSLLETSTTPPTTTATAPADFLDGYRRATERSQKVLCITIGSNFSGNYTSAVTAAELGKQELPEAHIEVVDSGSAAMAEGFVVLAAARSTSFDEAIQQTQAVIPRTYLIGALDTLYYVARSGRVPKVVAWASSLLQIKPIFEYHGGVVTPLERVRTRPRALERLLSLMEQRLSHAGPLHVAVVHARAEAEAQTLAQQVQGRFAPAELLITEFSQVMAVHTGPGLVGLAFYNG